MTGGKEPPGHPSKQEAGKKPARPGDAAALEEGAVRLPQGGGRKRPAKILLLVLTLLPTVLFLVDVVWLSLAFGFFFTSGGGEAYTPDVLFFLLMFAVPAVCFVGLMALTAVYVIDASRNPRLKQEMRLFWAVVFLLGLVTVVNPVLLPVYWYYYIWREPEAVERAAGA